jgi:hypothetical protein
MVARLSAGHPGECEQPVSCHHQRRSGPFQRERRPGRAGAARQWGRGLAGAGGASRGERSFPRYRVHSDETLLAGDNLGSSALHPARGLWLHLLSAQWPGFGDGRFDCGGDRSLLLFYLDRQSPASCTEFLTRRRQSLAAPNFAHYARKVPAQDLFDAGIGMAPR